MANLITPVQGVLLDVDGTCLDSMKWQHRWLERTAKKYGGISPFPAFGAEFLAAYNRWYAEKKMPGLYEMVGVDFHEHHETIWQEYTAFNRTHPIIFVPGVDKAIHEIYRRSRATRARPCALRIGLNTTKTWADIEKPLKRAGIISCLDTIVTKDQIYEYATDSEARKKGIAFDDFEALRHLVQEHIVRELEKPGTLATMLALQRLSVESDAVIAFEDTVEGILAYKAVLQPRRRTDVFVVGVLWGYEQNRKELLKAQPDMIIERPEQMAEIVGDYGGFS